MDKPRYREASQSRERPSVWILYTEPTLLTGADNNNRLTGDPSPWLVLLSSGTGTAAFLPNIKGERATSFPVVLFFARYLYLLPLCSRFLPVVGRSRRVVFVYGAEHGAVPDVPVFFPIRERLLFSSLEKREHHFPVHFLPRNQCCDKELADGHNGSASGALIATSRNDFRLANPGVVETLLSDACFARCVFVGVAS